MDFMPLHFENFFTTLIWGIVGLYAVPLAIIVAGLWYMDSKRANTRRKQNLALIPVIAGMLGVLGLVCVQGVHVSQNFEAEKEARIQAAETLNEAYGTDITESELKDYRGLFYPKERPDSDFEVFGFVERDVEKPGNGFERQTIYLIWQDEKLQLAQSADGETFTVLKGSE